MFLCLRIFIDKNIPLRVVFIIKRVTDKPGLHEEMILHVVSRSIQYFSNCQQVFKLQNNDFYRPLLT